MRHSRPRNKAGSSYFNFILQEQHGACNYYCSPGVLAADINLGKASSAHSLTC